MRFTRTLHSKTVPTTSPVDAVETADVVVTDVSSQSTNFAAPLNHPAQDNVAFAATPPATKQHPFQGIKPMSRWIQFQRVLKASIAFSAACLLTFYPHLDQENHKRDNVFGYWPQTAASAILFFHPVKTIGAMFESLVAGIFGTVVGLFSAMLCGYAAVWTRAYWPQHEALAASSVLSILFLTTFSLSYFRAKSSKPSIYTGVILAHLIVFQGLVDCANQNITSPNIKPLLQSLASMWVGVAISLLVNWVLWPSTASYELKKNITGTIETLQYLLDQLTFTFLSVQRSPEYGTPIAQLNDAHIQDAMKHLHQQFINLTCLNADAKLESLSTFFRHIFGRGSASNGLNRSTGIDGIVQSLNRLVQHIGGMHSSVVKEWIVLQRLRQKPEKPARKTRLKASQNASEMLFNFIEHVGPATQQLSFECRRVLGGLSELITKTNTGRSKKRYNPEDDLNQVLEYCDDLNNASVNFLQSQQEDLGKMFEKQKFDGKPNDQLFLVYFFIFCLMEFSKEVQSGILETVREMKEDEVDRYQNYWRRMFQWFRCGRRNRQRTASFVENLTDLEAPSETTPLLGSSRKETDDNRFRDLFQLESNSIFHKFLRTNKKAETTSQTPPRISFFLRQRLRLWRFLSNLGNSFELKFAFKTAFVVTAVAACAFIKTTKPFFVNLGGTSSMISIVVISAPSVGGSNSAGIYRLFGTLFGSAYAFFAWTLFPGHPFGLWTMLTVFAVASFHLLLNTPYPKVAQVSLFTVTATILQHFANLENPLWIYDIWGFSWRNALMMNIGIVIGLLVTWYVWPYEARVELRKELSDFFLNVGILYSRLVQVFNANSTTGSSKSSQNITPSNVHQFYYAEFDGSSTVNALQYFLAFEFKLQMSLMHLKQLLPLTRHEPRLKGPFPIEIYDDVLRKCQKMLDKLVAMRIAVSNNVSTIASLAHATKNATNKARRTEDLILGLAPRASYYVNALSLETKNVGTSENSKSNPSSNNSVETLPHHPDLLPLRRELVGSILLCFYTYAASLLIKQPLPTYLPPARASRARLLTTIHAVMSAMQARTETKRWGKAPPVMLQPERYINYYAYALAMEDVIETLENVGDLLKNLFGEVFADVVQLEEEQYDTSLYDRIEKLSSPVHHHNRNDQWGARRMDEIEGKSQRNSAFRGKGLRSPLVATVSSPVEASSVSISGQDDKEEAGYDDADWRPGSGAWML